MLVNRFVKDLLFPKNRFWDLISDASIGELQMYRFKNHHFSLVQLI